MTYSERIAQTVAAAWKLEPLELDSLSKEDLLSAYAIHVTLADLFVRSSDEARWLRDPLPILGGLSPLERMRQGADGVREVEALTGRMANR